MSFDLKYYVSIFLRRLPYFLVVAVLCASVGIALAAILPPNYRSEAVLLVESEQIPDDLAPSTVQTGTAEELQIIEQRLTARANLLEIADRLELYPDRSAIDANLIVEDMRDRLELLVTAPRDGVPMLSVAFEGETPQQALQGANDFVTLILRENVEMRTDRATGTLEFFEQEAARLGADLDRQEAEILAFRQANQDSLPDSLDYRRGQQQQLQAQLLQFQRDEALASERRRRLVELYENTGRVDAAEAELTPDQRQLQEAEAMLAQALVVYSPQNPRVRMLQAQVDSLKLAIASEAGNEPQEPGDPELSMLELQLEEIDGELESIASQRAELQAELENVTAMIEATPANAATLSELERENQITRNQYSDAVARLAAAQRGERIEVMSKGQRISVIEPAQLPSSPSSPNRPLIAGAGIGGGIVLGIALVVLIELLNQAVRRPADIVSRLGITPIATLPYLRTDREMRVRRAVFGSIAFVGLLGIFGGLYALHTYYLPMDILVGRVMDRTGITTLLGEVRQGVSG